MQRTLPPSKFFSRKIVCCFCCRRIHTRIYYYINVPPCGRQTYQNERAQERRKKTVIPFKVVNSRTPTPGGEWIQRILLQGIVEGARKDTVLIIIILYRQNGRIQIRVYAHRQFYAWSIIIRFSKIKVKENKSGPTMFYESNALYVLTVARGVKR